MQLPYLSTFESIWEYREAFVSEGIDFPSVIGSACPICGECECYRMITPYQRYAIDLFPGWRKEEIPIARFLCKKRWRTFSLLPIQLIPYVRYTVEAVVGTLLIGLGCWEAGKEGFWGAAVEVDPDSLVTPWLVFCWLQMALSGLRRCHWVLNRWYNLTFMSSSALTNRWEQVRGYFQAFGWRKNLSWKEICEVVRRCSQTTVQFLFGAPSQQRKRQGIASPAP